MAQELPKVRTSTLNSAAQGFVCAEPLMSACEPSYASETEEPIHPLAEDVLHYQAHYGDFFAEFEVLSIEASRQEAFFRIAGMDCIARSDSKTVEGAPDDKLLPHRGGFDRWRTLWKGGRII